MEALPATFAIVFRLWGESIVIKPEQDGRKDFFLHAGVMEYNKLLV